ncbi:peroxisomal succinyl-coenzyme A thioesterase-like isoform 2-T2 [Pholidichthys leucotaenia]
MDRNQTCVKLSVEPSRGLVDEKILVLVQNGFPGSQLTIHALHQCEDGHHWEAFAHYNADATGTVNVSQDRSSGGTYSGVEPMGLLWSLRPVPGSKPGLRMRRKDVWVPMVVRVSVYRGHQIEGFPDQTPLAIVVLERWYIAPGVQRIPVTEDRLTATLFLPPGPGPSPGIIDLWGGGGQLVEYRAALLASRGFAALALDFLTPKVTIETGKAVGNDYFELSCAVSISGSHVQPVDGSIAEILNYFDTNRAKTRFNENNEVIWKDLLLPIPTDPSLKVDMGRIQCPLMLIVGEDDQNWPACESAADIKDMMERAGNNHLLTLLSYPHAGHLIEPPYLPHTRTSLFKSLGKGEKYMVLWGGQMLEHSRAQEDSWRKLLVFLREHLYGGSTSAVPSHL